MTTIVIALGTVALFTLAIVIAVVFAIKNAKREGAAEVIRQIQEQEVKDVNKTSEIMLDNRTSDDTVDKLRDGNF